MTTPVRQLSELSPVGLERLSSKFDPSDAGCWEWRGARRPSGYGVMGDSGKQFSAHRLVYELLRAPIPPGLVLDHLCRNRACVNPDHLEPVTNVENILRGVGLMAANRRKTACKRGHLFTPENTRTTKLGRSCRECIRIRGRRAYAESKR